MGEKLRRITITLAGSPQKVKDLVKVVLDATGMRQLSVTRGKHQGKHRIGIVMACNSSEYANISNMLFWLIQGACKHDFAILVDTSAAISALNDAYFGVGEWTYDDVA